MVSGLIIETDITDEIETNRTLKLAEQRQRQLLDQIAVAVWLEDWSRSKPLAERALQAADGDLAAYLADHPDVVVSIDKSIESLPVNRTALDKYGYESAEQFDTINIDLVTPGTVCDLAGHVV